ncbi:MAG: ATP-binding protein [Candidatus Sabulitectum sp.]|nr:ATP-binding protein [Candidatus Sabulitectum sp.]
MSRVEQVIIASGIPGAGKSTWIRRNTNPYMTEVFSADDFFHDKNGRYQFDPAKLSDAHSSCLRNFTLRLLHLNNCAGNSCRITLVVDNTNTSAWEIAPYYSLSQAFSIPVKIVRIIVAPETAFPRNIHGVNKEMIQKMAERINEKPLPAFWNVEEVNAGE